MFKFILPLLFLSLPAAAKEFAIGCAFTGGEKIILEPSRIKLSYFDNPSDVPIRIKSFFLYVQPNQPQSLKGVIYYSDPDTGYPVDLAAVTNEYFIVGERGWVELSFEQEVILEPKDLYIGVYGSNELGRTRIIGHRGGEVVIYDGQYPDPPQQLGDPVRLVSEKLISTYLLVEEVIPEVGCEGTNTPHMIFGLTPDTLFDVYFNNNLIYTQLLSSPNGSLIFHCDNRGHYEVTKSIVLKEYW